MDLGFPIWVGVVCDDLEGQRRFYEDVLTNVGGITITSSSGCSSPS